MFFPHDAHIFRKSPPNPPLRSISILIFLVHPVPEIEPPLVLYLGM